MRRLQTILCLASWLAMGGSVQAQISPQQLAEVNRAAMDAYNNLDVEAAKTKLDGAVEDAEAAGLTGAALARTYANLGVVLVGGLGDTEAGYAAFEKALAQDATVEPDPIVATPEIVQVFDRARAASGGEGALPEVEDPDATGPVAQGYDSECPPGMPGCSGPAGLGDTCRQDSDCQAGLSCSDDFCTLDDGDDDDDGEESEYERFFLELNFGLAATYVGGNNAPDRRISRERLAQIDSETPRVDGFLDEPAFYQAVYKAGWDCDDISVDDIANRPVVGSCSVALDNAGLVATPVLNAAFGVHLTSRVALALTGRVQLKRGEGPLAGILVGGRLDYLLTTPKPEGARVAMLVGAGVGSIQARPRANNGAKGPYASSAYVGGVGAALQLGLKVGYRFTDNVGIHLTPLLSAGLPSLLFNGDVLGGLELAF